MAYLMVSAEEAETVWLMLGCCATHFANCADWQIARIDKSRATSSWNSTSAPNRCRWLLIASQLLFVQRGRPAALTISHRTCIMCLLTVVLNTAKDCTGPQRTPERPQRTLQDFVSFFVWLLEKANKDQYKIFMTQRKTRMMWPFSGTLLQWHLSVLKRVCIPF